jgi:uncharacterized protein YdaU (DUF1376 family)
VNFYKHHINDYAQATSHLTLVEDAIYRRLLCKYYADELPLPADLATVERLVGTKTPTERESLQSVLDEFFIREPDGWHNKRCDEELAAASAKGDERMAKAANERARQRRHRDERKAMFAQLRGLGVTAPWDATMEALRAMLNAQPVTRDMPDLSRVTGAPVTRDMPTGHAPVTRTSRPVTRAPVTPVTRTATAIPDSKTPRLNSAAPSSNTAPLAPQGTLSPGPLPGSVSTLDPDRSRDRSVAAGFADAAPLASQDSLRADQKKKPTSQASTAAARKTEPTSKAPYARARGNGKEKATHKKRAPYGSISAAVLAFVKQRGEVKSATEVVKHATHGAPSAIYRAIDLLITSGQVVKTKAGALTLGKATPTGSKAKATP